MLILRCTGKVLKEMGVAKSALEDARAGASGALTAAGALWIVGGDGDARVDRVVFGADGPAIVPNAFPLSGPRADAMVVEQASGVVVVIGGEGPDGVRGDVELCFPPELDPL